MTAPSSTIRSGVAVWAAILAIAVAAAGCGSSTPPYCSQRTSLANAVKGLPSTVVAGGVDGLNQQLETIKKDANELVSSAKSDFPSETSAIRSSVNAMSSAVQGLPPDPSAAQLAPLAANAGSVVNSVKSFSNAAGSNCD
jgi:hypothetical protein